MQSLTFIICLIEYFFGVHQGSILFPLLFMQLKLYLFVCLKLSLTKQEIRSDCHASYIGNEISLMAGNHFAGGPGTEIP